MTAVTTLPWGRPLTRADLARLPDDGHRYELIDGTLVVSPSPRHLHQRAVARVLVLLSANQPEHLEALVAPFDVVLADDTVVQPDVVLAAAGAFGEQELAEPPLLVVEVLSPSTRRVDLLLKRDRYAAAGIPSYWLVDVDEPSVEILQLVGSAYELVARAAGEERLSVTSPYPLTICAADLIR